MIQLRTLGSLELTSSDGNTAGPVLTQPRRAALLCYLALAAPRGFHRRDTLLALFWPEYDADQARHALRQSVYFLRRMLGPQTIVSRGDDDLALASPLVSCDVWDLEAAMDQGRPADALALYRGELLAGFHISDAPEFERWLDDERARTRRLAVEAGWALAAAREREGDADGAAEAARRAAALAPSDETALRRQIALLERLGDRAAAMRAYEAFVQKLEGEYELEPSAETRALVARLRAESGRLETPLTGFRPGPPDLPPDIGLRSRGLFTESAPFSSPSRSPRPAAIVAGALAVLLLLGLAGLHFRTQAPRRAVPPPSTDEAASAVAVLPFAVQDAALANWREGLVDLLSLNFSGVPGLRPLDSRALLARWRNRGTVGQAPELATALEVAELAGARYAVVGSVLANGSHLVVTAGVHEVAGRRMLGTARSQGPADSIFTVVDRLTLEILRLILTGDARELPQIDLARVSTSSLPALKSYLEGEVHFRLSRFQPAADAYARAVEADSTFALARYRLGLARRWFWTDSTGSAPDPLTELGRFTRRLPRHEAAIVRGILLRGQDVRAAREVLEEEARRHPDDAETWYELGELYYHSGDQALAPLGAADRAFAKAIELDSTLTLPYTHRLDHAISVGDTTGAARLLATFIRLARESPYVAQYRLLTGLTLGDSTVRSTVEVALDTLETRRLFWLGIMLKEQRLWILSEHVFRKVRERGELRPDATRVLFWVSLAQGKAQDALRWVDDPFMPEEPKGLMLQMLDELGVRIPAARLDSTLSLDLADSANAFRLFYAGSYAASRARWQVLRSSLEQMESRALQLRATGDSAEADFTDAMQQGLEGYAWWRRGQRENALRLLERSQSRAVGNWRRETVNARIRWWLARLLMEMRRPREALPYFESLTRTLLPADYERSRIYEQLGMGERAREAYALFLARRQHADPMFQPMIRDARMALHRLAVATRE